MNLKLLREHYRKRGSKWSPKRAFDTKEQIKEELGFDPDRGNVYTCKICNKLHIRYIKKEYVNVN